ncbi:hypothetical protein TNCV_3810691 [Trichonephila clavipes]|nr:hypothetical protein TNCV_3810691 [Trichonephila clavipes]
MGQEVRLSLGLSTMQVTVRFSSAKFPEGKIDGETPTLSPPPQFLQGILKGKEIFSSPCARDSAHRTTDPLIYRARAPCVL